MYPRSAVRQRSLSGLVPLGIDHYCTTDRQTEWVYHIHVPGIRCQYSDRRSLLWSEGALLGLTTSLYAKVCNAYDYANAQGSRELDRYHRDAVLYKLSLDTPSV